MDLIYTEYLESDEPVMLINKHIGMDADDGMGIDGALFQKELLYLDTLGKKRIKVWINSLGGVVIDGYNIYNAISKTNTPVDTYCVGACASIAGVIFQAGRKRYMADYGWLMYHNPFGSDDKTLIGTMTDSLIKMIAAKCELTESQVEGLMDRTTFINAQEAIQMKLCDAIESSTTLNTKYLKKITNSMQFQKECKSVVNSILNNQPLKNTSMLKVTMKLNLNDSAPESAIIAAIEAIENKGKVADARADAAEDKINAAEKKAKEAENKADAAENKTTAKAKDDADEMDKLKAKLEKAKADVDAIKSEMDGLKNKVSAMEEEEAKAKAKVAEDNAKNMVTNFAKMGRIKNTAESIVKWSGLAVKDFDGTKAMIEDLPLNKAAIIIPIENKLEGNEVGTTAVGLMAKILNKHKI